jgi:hypothetical protein
MLKIARSSVTGSSTRSTPWMTRPSKKLKSRPAPPIGASNVTSSPAAKPSSETNMLCTRVRGMARA